MFKKKKYKLKDFVKNRKEKISLFGVSVAFDWFLLTVIFAFVMIIVFVFSLRELDSIKNFDIQIEEEVDTQKDKEQIINQADKILNKFDEKKAALINELVD